MGRKLLFLLRISRYSGKVGEKEEEERQLRSALLFKQTQKYATLILFLYMCEPNLTNIFCPIETSFQQIHKLFSTHVSWYNL